MKNFFQITLVAVMLFAASATASAQKFGYVNSGDILAELPEMKQAESNLEARQKVLQKQGQKMVQDFQTDLEALQAKAAAGELTPKMEQEEGAKMEQRRQEIGSFEQKMIADLQEERAKLLQPIYDAINAAIEGVAKEGGYQLIFDQQILLYGQDTADVSDAVKTKLQSLDIASFKKDMSAEGGK